jgi:hypothetical protein
MNTKRWTVALAIVLVVDVGIGVVLLRMGLEDNCNNGISRWQCSNALGDLLRVAAITITGIYVISLLVAIARARLDREP